MKNIHLIPTDKLSRLHTYKGVLNLAAGEFVAPAIVKNDLINQNIYITSDLDINEDDYIITSDGKLVQVSYLLSNDVEGGSKIILTTDQELINDGIQSIDDEFLEWFINNPSCEYISVEKYYSNEFGDSKLDLYRIIIPKEETFDSILDKSLAKSKLILEELKAINAKREMLEASNDKLKKIWEMGEIEELDEFIKGKKYLQQDGVIILAGGNKTDGMVITDIKNTRGVGYYSVCWNPKAFKLYTEPKQGIIENAAKKYEDSFIDANGTESVDFIAGAEWQAERMYSEEESIQKIIDYVDFQFNANGELNTEIKNWFEQFKKK